MSSYIKKKIEIALLKQALNLSDRYRNGVKITKDVIIPSEYCNEIKLAVFSAINRLILEKEAELESITPVFEGEYISVDSFGADISFDIVSYEGFEYILDLDNLNVSNSPTVLIKGYRIGERIEHEMSEDGNTITRRIPYYNIRWSKDEDKILCVFTAKRYEEKIILVESEPEEPSDEENSPEEPDIPAEELEPVENEDSTNGEE